MCNAFGVNVGFFGPVPGCAATLATLGDFFPVPAAELTREFEAGASPEEVCARTIRALRGVGATNVYVSNLGRGAAGRLNRILELV